MMRSFFLFIVLVMCTLVCSGQTETIVTDTLRVEKDTIGYQEQTDRYTLFSAFGGPPGRAALYGLVVPAGGQFYNRKYVKGSIFLVGEISMLVFALDQQNYFNLLDEDYKTILGGGVIDPATLNFGITDRSTIQNERQSARQAKDYVWLGLGLVHLFVIAEAFVNRHLMEFDVTDDLSFKINPYPGPNLLSLTYSFN